MPVTRAINAKIARAGCYYLLIIWPAVQVVDKTFQLHTHCAIASLTLLLACASCQ